MGSENFEAGGNRVEGFRKGGGEIMASENVRLHIMKHDLEYYVKREGASEKDIRQEKKVLDDVAEKLENFKDFINSGCSGGC